MKARRTAAIVARSLLAAVRSSWLVGLLVGEVVVRREPVWPVVGSVVVAVDMKWFLFWCIGRAGNGCECTLSPQMLTAVENGGAGRSKMVALGGVDLP